MKFAAFLSTLLAVATPINAENGFVFDLPSIVPGAPNPAASFHVNLTGIHNTTFAGSGAAQLSQTLNQDLMNALEHQIPAYIRTYQDSMKLAGQECDFQCCEAACFAVIWIPFATIICIEMCKAKYGG
ncbi:hypothetical protein QBC37DRAFT_487819 [Rhypophila decipiens]|uniref:Uncharacterized protein n=1 Tax=Rhypophila decipiens TaxID=261697 RepID=A0AAN6XU80_9PEZI|nr:hypothetical protein QBC37DRAFT_487819 [Rhypophila decipiens]